MQNLLAPSIQSTRPQSDHAMLTCPLSNSPSPKATNITSLHLTTSPSCTRHPRRPLHTVSNPTTSSPIGPSPEAAMHTPGFPGFVYFQSTRFSGGAQGVCLSGRGCGRPKTGAFRERTTHSSTNRCFCDLHCALPDSRVTLSHCSDTHISVVDALLECRPHWFKTAPNIRPVSG